MEFYYFPILKSRDAELRAYEKLSEIDKVKILPILELTRSRITQKNQKGSVKKKMEEISRIFSENYFILDLTTEETLDNDEIQNMLLSNNDGYKEWVDFVMKYNELGLNFIPCIHYNPDRCGIHQLVGGDRHPQHRKR